MQNELGKGSFQELDQVKVVKQFTKYAGQAKKVQDIVSVIESAVKVISWAAELSLHIKSCEKAKAILQ